MDFKNPESILVVQTGKIGDMILTTPLFSELKSLFPQSGLTVLASEVNKDIPLNHKSVDKVIIFKKNIFKNLNLLKYLFGKIDLWIDTKDNYSKTGEMLLKLFNPKLSVGFLFENGNINFDVFLNDHVSGKHAVDLNLSPVNYFKKQFSNIKSLPSIEIPSEIENSFDKIIVGDIHKKLLINVSAGNKTRYISKEKWTELTDKLIEIEGLKFYLIGIETDKELINYILKNTKVENIKHIPTNNILETCEVIRKCDLVITPDTSVVHICSAFNKPVAALYPDVKWNLEKFSPLSDYNEVVISKNKNSINDIGAEEIYAAVIRLLQKMNSGNAESRTRVRKEDH